VTGKGKLKCSSSAAAGKLAAPTLPSGSRKESKLNKIYLVERTDGVDYDEYDAIVVVCASAKTAREIHPHTDNGKMCEPKYSCSWTRDTKSLKVTCIGVASKHTAPFQNGIVLGSFNAG